MSEDIKFISDITVRVTQQMGSDASIVAAAKVSTSGEDALQYALAEATEGNYGLIKCLMKLKHTSPLEHSAITFFTHAPIFVFREWQRHRIASYNEESARYRELKPVFWIPRETRKMKPVEGFKPIRPQFELVDKDTYKYIIGNMKKLYKDAYAAYQDMIKHNIATEVARAVLPVGIYSSCWVTMNPRSLMHFLSLRTHEPTAAYVSYPQAEIEEAARAIEEIFAKNWPLTYRAFLECGRTC